MTSPVAYIVVSKPERRMRIVDDLRRQGWAVIEQPTGCHLLAALGDVIEGNANDLPGKIVIEARAERR